MPDPSSTRPRRAKGSWIPRLTGLGIVVVLAAGGLTAYLASQHPAPSPRRHRPAALSSKIVRAQTVGIIDFGPDDDGDPFANDPDDHPLMLEPTRTGLEFATISRAEMTNGTPLWTANLMGDGSEIFIYTPNGLCLAAGRQAGQVVLARCNLGLGQRWRARHAVTVLGQAIAAYANAETGGCLTAPAPAPEKVNKSRPGPARLAACGPARDKTQEIAFWWSA
ncbi:MAG TPA: hypothetical protein VLX31_09600 [Streptosporangiaceae bacterium]|nr:hypothetical protein [Streptosporangiaceae bacterium]